MNKFSLEKHPKITSGFTTPEHYFEELPFTILEKIKNEQFKEKPVFHLKEVFYAVAALIILALSIPFLSRESSATIEQIDTNSLENYISYQSNVSQYDLISLMNYEELEDIQIELVLENQSVEDILTTNPNFENYLID